MNKGTEKQFCSVGVTLLLTVVTGGGGSGVGQLGDGQLGLVHGDLIRILLYFSNTESRLEMSTKICTIHQALFYFLSDYILKDEKHYQ
jgi:hypothetical protein